MHDDRPLQGVDWPEGALESALARNGLGEHFKVAHQAPGRISEGGGLVLLEEEMSNPSKAIADDWGRHKIFKATHNAQRTTLSKHKQTRPVPTICRRRLITFWCSDR